MDTMKSKKKFIRSTHQLPTRTPDWGFVRTNHKLKTFSDSYFAWQKLLEQLPKFSYT